MTENERLALMQMAVTLVASAMSFQEPPPSLGIPVAARNDPYGAVSTVFDRLAEVYATKNPPSRVQSIPL